MVENKWEIDMCLNGQKCDPSRGFYLKVVGFGELDKKCEKLLGEVNHIFKDKMEMTRVCASIYSL